MKGRYLILILFTLSLSSAQTSIITSPSVISGSGGTWIQDNYNLCFTLGELVIETKSQQSTIITQGFHQENYQITGLGDYLENSQVRVFPNPATEQIIIDVDTEKSECFLRLTDLQGKLLYEETVLSIEKKHQIDMSSFAKGIYFLSIMLSPNNKTIYKIQKIN